MAAIANIDIGILLYPGVQLSAVHGLTDMFTVANRLNAGPHALRVSHWRPTTGHGTMERVFASDGTPHDGLTVLIVPPSLDRQPLGPDAGQIMDWIRAVHRRGATVCSVCAGAFLLAEAGLLDGRPATTHWGLADELADRFPRVRVDAAKLIVDDGDILTAGGVMAWVELGLRLVDRFAGPSVMLAVARFFLVDPAGREQRFYSNVAPKLHHGDAAVLKAQHWLQANAEHRVTLAAMAEQAGLGERTFLRRFQRATGLTPTRYVQHLRVGKARGLLESSTLAFEQIAWRVGYEDPGALRKVFHAVMGLSPGEYRRRFGVAPAHPHT